MANPGLRNLVSIRDLSPAELIGLLDRAEDFLAPQAISAYRNRFPGQALVLAFEEPSTRTRFSFELAAHRLGMDVLNFTATGSSRSKGESLGESFTTFANMGVRLFVLRHGKNGIMAEVAERLPRGTGLINAGEGTRSHPTQGLLDVLTIRRYRPEFDSLRVAIVGDIVHSRVAHSTLDALTLLGTRDIRLVGPPALLPPPGECPGTKIDSLEAGLAGADVVIALRIQNERIPATERLDLADFRHSYGLDRDRLERLAAPDSLLLHPGPVNWGIELAEDLIERPRTLIREQVSNGVAVRMAVLAHIAESLNAPD